MATPLLEDPDFPRAWLADVTIEDLHIPADAPSARTLAERMHRVAKSEALAALAGKRLTTTHQLPNSVDTIEIVLDEDACLVEGTFTRLNDFGEHRYAIDSLRLDPGGVAMWIRASTMPNEIRAASNVLIGGACTTTLGAELEEKILAVSEWSYLLHEYSCGFEPRGSIYVELRGKTQLEGDLRRASAVLTAALWTPFGSTERDIADALTLDGWWGPPPGAPCHGRRHRLRPSPSRRRSRLGRGRFDTRSRRSEATESPARVRGSHWLMVALAQSPEADRLRVQARHRGA